MLIDKNKKWLFISTMKCATNSIYKAVSGRRIGTFHETTKDRLADVHFTVKRNPYSRAVSIWSSTSMRGDDRYNARARVLRCGGNPDNFADFCKYCLGEHWTDSYLFRSQSDWWKESLIDEFIDIDNIDSEIKRITGQDVVLPVLNSSEAKVDIKALHQSIIDIITKWAIKDFEYGYEIL